MRGEVRRMHITEKVVLQRTKWLQNVRYLQRENPVVDQKGTALLKCLVRVVEMFQNVGHENDIKLAMDIRLHISQSALDIRKISSFEHRAKFRRRLNAEDFATTLSGPPKKKALARPDFKKTTASEWAHLFYTVELRCYGSGLCS
jgi:hypothetical protein